MKAHSALAGFLVFAIVIGYFASIALITFADVTDGRLAQVIGLVTAVQNAFMLIVGYYFGSSAGSARKSDTIDQIAGTGDGTVIKEANINTANVTNVGKTDNAEKTKENQ